LVFSFELGTLGTRSAAGGATTIGSSIAGVSHNRKPLSFNPEIANSQRNFRVLFVGLLLLSEFNVKKDYIVIGILTGQT
jgi:hypothetical protein